MDQQLLEQQISPDNLETGASSGIHQPPTTASRFTPRDRIQMRVLSIIQMVVGSACVLLNVAELAVLSTVNYIYYDDTIGYSRSTIYGLGIGYGCIYILVGGIGFGASKSSTACWIVSSMVLSITCSAVCCLLMATFSSLCLAVAVGGVDTYYPDWTPSSLPIFPSYEKGVFRSVVATNSLVLIASVTEFLITIWSTVLCCKAMCCRPKRNPAGHLEAGTQTCCSCCSCCCCCGNQSTNSGSVSLCCAVLCCGSICRCCQPVAGVKVVQYNASTQPNEQDNME